MNDNFKVAILQMQSENTMEDNIKKGIEYCRSAKKMGADIAVFPEMWNNGYEDMFDGSSVDNKSVSTERIEDWIGKAVTDNGLFVKSYIELAKKLNMAIAITYLEKSEKYPKNTVAIIDRTGKIVLKYSKIHTVDFKMEFFTTPGEEFRTCELEYEGGKVNIGAMICFDREFPESARILMLKGAEIVIVPNACGMTKIRLEQLKVRAFENMFGIATVNYPNLGGKSSAYSPIVRDINKKELNSEICVMGSEEAIKLVEFDLKEIRDYRKRETFGDTYRKPYAYSELIRDTVREPFIRDDSRRKFWR